MLFLLPGIDVRVADLERPGPVLGRAERLARVVNHLDRVAAGLDQLLGEAEVREVGVRLVLGVDDLVLDRLLAPEEDHPHLLARRERPQRPVQLDLAAGRELALAQAVEPQRELRGVVRLAGVRRVRRRPRRPSRSSRWRRAAPARDRPESSLSWRRSRWSWLPPESGRRRYRRRAWRRRSPSRRLPRASTCREHSAYRARNCREPTADAVFLDGSLRARFGRSRCDQQREGEGVVEHVQRDRRPQRPGALVGPGEDHPERGQLQGDADVATGQVQEPEDQPADQRRRPTAAASAAGRRTASRGRRAPRRWRRRGRRGCRRSRSRSRPSSCRRRGSWRRPPGAARSTALMTIASTA